MQHSVPISMLVTALFQPVRYAFVITLAL